jgi:hypothetical protein
MKFSHMNPCGDWHHGPGACMSTSRRPEAQLELPPTNRASDPSRAQAADYLQAVADVAQATVDGRDPGEVFGLIVHVARTLIGAASSTIGTIRPEPTSLTIRAADGASAERLQVGAPIPVEGTLATAVVRTGKSPVIPGRASASEPFRTILLRFELGAIQDLRNYVARLRPGVLTNHVHEPFTLTQAPPAGMEHVVPAATLHGMRARQAFEDRMNAIGDTNQATVDGVDVDTIFRRLAHSARAMADRPNCHDLIDRAQSHATRAERLSSAHRTEGCRVWSCYER